MTFLLAVAAFANSQVHDAHLAEERFLRLSISASEPGIGHGSDPVATIEVSEYWDLRACSLVGSRSLRTDIDPETGEKTESESTAGAWVPELEEMAWESVGYSYSSDAWELQPRVGESTWPMPTTAEVGDSAVNWFVPGHAYAAVADADGDVVDPTANYTPEVTLWGVGPGGEMQFGTLEASREPVMHNVNGTARAYWDPRGTCFVIDIEVFDVWGGTHSTRDYWELPLTIEVIRSKDASASWADSVASVIEGRGHQVRRSESGNAHDTTKVFVKEDMRPVVGRIGAPSSAEVLDLTWESAANAVVVVGKDPPAPPTTPVPPPIPTVADGGATAPSEGAGGGMCVCSAAALPAGWAFWVVLAPLAGRVRRRT